MKRPRAVLDAGVLVSALLRPQGPPGGLLLQLVKRRAFELVLTEQILQELQETLEDPDVRRHVGGAPGVLDRWSAAVGLLATQVDDGPVPESAVTLDPGDDKYMAAAVESGAPLVVSSDRHLLEADAPSGVEVITPRVFLELLELGDEV